MGYVDVKSVPVYFYVQKTTSYTKVNFPITYEVARLNIGGAMNLGTGKFTAPREGTYFFSFSGNVRMGSTTKDGWVDIDLILNGNRVGRGKAQLTQGLSDDAYSLQSTLHLQKGDQVWVANYRNRAYMYDDGAHSTHFTGWLLEEDIALSLTTA